MANYCGSARMNYFRVKDASAFRTWAKRFALGVVERDGHFCLLPGERSDSGTFYLFDEDEDDSLDVCDEIAAHLVEDSVAIVIESGAKYLRYISGWAVAINSRGERVEITLDAIYKLAEEKFGIIPTQAFY